MFPNDNFDLLQSYLNEISAVETHEWAGFIERDNIIPIMNNIILRWLTLLSKTNSVSKSHLNNICQGCNEKIDEIIKMGNETGYQKETYQKTITDIQDLLNKIKSINNTF